MPTDPLEGALQGLSLNELLMLLEHLLPYEGFGDCEILRRRRGRQKSTYGGFEIRCRTKLGSEPGTVLVKVVADHPLRTRQVHELAGCVLEHDALMGLLISPFKRSRSRAFSQALDPKLRVRVIDGPSLARLVKCSGRGVRPGGGVDYAFFARLDAASNMVLQTVERMREVYR